MRGNETYETTSKVYHASGGSVIFRAHALRRSRGRPSLTPGARIRFTPAMKPLTGALWAALVATSLLACKPKAGDACSSGQAACQDDKTELVCEGGKFIAAPCKGAKGCKTEGSTQTCDSSANAPGDVCGKVSEGHTHCTPDHKSKIVCAGGKYTVSPCRGPDGCKETGEAALCDISVAAPGDACGDLKGGAFACSVDKKALLECKGGKFVVNETCKKACGTKGDSVGCDLE